MNESRLDVGRARIAEIRAALLAFYETRRRDLPWRRDADPYRVWVSEIMLQQTRVEAVIPYYERWLARFPTLDALAGAEPDDVLRQWEGLGYYSRARNLHRAARIVRDRHDGAVPGGYDALRELPGVGEYTAGAIASIAFGEAVPAVDGNVRRVLCRLLDAELIPAAALRRLARALVPRDRPGDFNQALMELGATVCTPRSPDCAGCPLHNLCDAYAAGTVALRPAPRRRPAPPEGDIATAVVVAPSGRVLLVRRPESGLLAGMWECPGVAPYDGEPLAEAAARAGAAALAGAAAPPGRATRRGGAGRHYEGGGGAGALPASLAPPPLPSPRALGSVAHTFTHLRLTYHGFLFRLAGEADAGLAADAAAEGVHADRTGGRADVAWAGPGEMGAFAVPVAQRSILTLAGLSGGPSARA